VTYRFLAPARSDFDDAVDWFASQQPASVNNFIAEAYATVQRMLATPHGFPRAGRVAGGRQARVSTVHRFGYLVYYEVTATELLILCVVHSKRGSHPWRQRLP